MKEIMEIQLPDIPARTHVDVLIPITEIDVTTGDCVFNLRNHPEAVEYTCLDCGFRTKVQTEMIAHQTNQARHHTWWQRFVRLFS